jgi:L-asparagine transporter-like permease
VPEDSSLLGAFGVRLFIVMWNYLGWDGVTTAAGEIDNPRRSLPRALLICVPFVVAAYVLPVMDRLTPTIDLADWTDGSFPEIAAQLGGEWLGT